MGFVNAGIFDDIEYSVVRAAEGTAHELKVLGKEPAFTNPIVVASIIANMLLFFIIFLMITPKLAPKNPE
jgi:hypothetical protein